MDRSERQNVRRETDDDGEEVTPERRPGLFSEDTLDRRRPREEHDRERVQRVTIPDGEHVVEPQVFEIQEDEQYPVDGREQTRGTDR